MTISQIIYVIKLSEYLNFTIAAKELFITQSTLSLQIKKLEEELNVDLFIREKSGVKLTDAGKDFVHFGRKVIADLDNLKVNIENYSELLKGELRIGLLWTFGSTDIGGIIHDFMNKYRGIKVSFYFDGSSNLIKKLNHHEIDIALVIRDTNNPIDNKFNFDLIDESDIILAVNKFHRFTSRKYVNFKDLDGENVMMVSKYSNIYPDIFNNINSSCTNVNIIGDTSIPDICYQIAEYGFGVSFMSLSSFDKINMGSDKAVAIPIFPTVKRNIYLASLKESMNNRIIEAFRDLVLYNK